MQWHYKKGDVWIGPISDEEKNRLVKSGVITRNTIISVCDDSATFVPANPSIKNDSWTRGANASVGKTDKYYYSGVHSDTRKEREIESVERELEGDLWTGDVEEWECGNKEDEGLEVSDENELENDELLDEDFEYFEEYNEDGLEEDEDSVVADDEETNFGDLEEVDEQEDRDDEDDGKSDAINDEKDVLAVASEDYLFNVAEFTNVESSEEDFDELAVLPDWNIGADDCLENEDVFADGDSSAPHELNRSDEQFSREALFEEQAERLKAIEEKLEKIFRDFNGFKTENNERLGVLEDGTKIVSEKYDELDANVKSISNDILNGAKDWEERFNFQAENNAIARENITGIKRKFNEEIEEKNRRLVDLEEKSEKYVKEGQMIDSKVNSLSCEFAFFKKRFDGSKIDNSWAAMKFGELEEKFLDSKRLTNNVAQFQDSIKQELESMSESILIQRNISNRSREFLEKSFSSLNPSSVLSFFSR